MSNNNKCIICGENIADTNFLSLEKGLHKPKYCEFHRRQIRSYRNAANVQRKELERWDNLQLIDFPFYQDRQANDRSMFQNYAIGGRDFGEWGGASHDGKTIVHIDKRILADKKQPVLIRKMLKVVDSRELHTYLTIEPASDLTIPASYAHFICDYYKTTLKGYGRDRNISTIIESLYTEILSGSSSARSGRFGNTWRLITSKDELLRTERKGVA